MTNTALEVRLIIQIFRENSPQWKPEKDVKHLAKRILLNHVPENWTLEEYNHKIMGIIVNESNDTFLYYQNSFNQNYYVFGDKQWIVIVGADQKIETAFPPDSYSSYLSEDKGYIYLGSIKEVLQDGQ